MKLRSSHLFYKRGVTMDEDNSRVETGKDQSTDDVGSVLTDSLPKEKPVVDLIESLTNQLNILKEVFSNKIDSINSDFSNKLDKKIDELKGELTDHFNDFQKEIKVHIDSRQAEFTKEIREKISDLKSDKLNVNEVATRIDTDSNIHSNLNDHQVLFDTETGQSNISNNNVVQINENTHSVMTEKVTLSEIVTPIKTFSLPCISETPESMKPTSSSYSVNATTGSNPLIVPCTVLPANILQNIPVLTVAPAHPSLTVCSSIIQSPITRPLKTIKPKLTTEEFIASNFDGDFDDCVLPIHRFKESSDRRLLPGHPRVRTRGGLRRGDQRSSCVISTVKDSCTLSPPDRGSNRGGRRGQKPKQYPLIRRQSERLKKLECDSPKKGTLRDTIGNIPIEEYIWGPNCNDKGEQVWKTDKTKIINDVNQSKGSENDDSSVLDSLSQIDTICNSIQNNKDKCDPPKKESDSLKVVENTNVSKHFEKEKGPAKAISQESSVKDKKKSNFVPKETPRNLRVPPKKGLSLSSPRKGSHVRALDFATPIKGIQPRKAHTSPKAVSQAKLAQMRSLRRTNLFKTPVKKSKPSWDADLRAFVAPDLSTATGSVKKNTRSKKPGRPQKFSSPIKKSLVKKANKKSDVRTLKNKKSSEAFSAENTLETSAETKSSPEASSSPGKLSKISSKSLGIQKLKATLKDPSGSSDIPKILPDTSETINKTSKANSKLLETPEKLCKSLTSSVPETPSKTAEELVKQIEKDVLEVISESDSSVDPANNNSTGTCSQNCSLDSSNDYKDKPNQTSTPEIQSRLDKNNRTKQSGDNFALPSQLVKKVIHKTPAKIDHAGLPNMMTPVTKILKEQSSLLDNIQFVTPGFLPTPEGQGLDADVRKVGTPSPNPVISKASEEMTDSDSDQSLEAMTECPVTIEEALAAEEEVVKPLATKTTFKSSVAKSLEKSPQDTSKSINKLSKKKTGSSFIKTGEENPIKKKSFEELMIDQCMKKVENDLFGVKVKKSPKKNKAKDNAKVKVMKNECINDKKSKKTFIATKNKAIEKGRVDIKLPSFDEMMTRLNKLNHISSSSSTDSSDTDDLLNNKNSGDVTNKQLTPSPNRVNSKEKIFNKQSSLDKFVKGLEKHEEGKKSVSKPAKNTTDTVKEVNKVSPTFCPSMMEQIRDFSFEYRNTSSALKALSYEYFDEAKNGDRTVQASPMYQLFQFPFHKKGKMSKNFSCDSNPEQTIKNPNYKKSKTLEFYHSSKKSDDKKLVSSISRNYAYLDESHSRLPKSIRLRSRDPCYSRRTSKTFLSSHRSRYSDRGTTPMVRHRRQSKEKYKDSAQSRYKRERNEEFRRRGRKDLDNRRSHSSDSKEYFTGFSKADSKKEKEYTRSSDHNNRKGRRCRSPGDSQKKRRDKFSPDLYRYRDGIYKHSSKRDSADKKGDKIEDRNRDFNCQSLDPRIYLKSRDFSCSKPLAQSTPCDRKKDKLDGSRESSNISLCKSTFYESDAKKSLRIDTSATSLERTLPQNVESSVKSTLLKTNFPENNMMSERGENPHDQNTGRLVTSIQVSEPRPIDLEQKYVSESPSSPQEPGNQSPPRDPRIDSKSYSYTRVVNSFQRQSTSFKRKQEDLEEGEITDDSSNSYQQSKYSSYSRKRKLSDIPEKDD